MIKDSLPKFIAEMKELAILLNASQKEIDAMEKYIGNMVRQFYISSADYSLNDWEKEFGIEKNSTFTIGQRRAQLLAKLNTRTPASIKMLENLVKKTLNADAVEITEVPEEYKFIVYVKSEYLIENMGIADAAVHKARPAHLNYEFINNIIRNQQKKIYVAVIGRTIIKKEGEVNTDGVSSYGSRRKSAYQDFCKSKQSAFIAG